MVNRKISELLPIVRHHLMDDTRLFGDTYICYAIAKAYTRGQLKVEEEQELRRLVYARMDAQNPEGAPNVMLIDCLKELDVIDSYLFAEDPDYWEHRDKWLDDWQAELISKGE
jgi:hypothetical protein